MLVIIPAFPPISPPQRWFRFLPVQYTIGKLPGTMWLSLYLLNVCSPEMPRRVLCPPGLEPPPSWWCRPRSIPPVRRCWPQAAGAALPPWCLRSQLSLSKSCLLYLFQEAHAGGSGGAERGSRQVLRSCVINRTGAEPRPALELSVITAPGRPVLAQAHTAVAVPTFPGC